MRTTIPGLHHVTAIAGSAQENVDFYAGLLGLRLVKRTVNFDDPGTYHLYYGDALGHPGTLLTFFPWAEVPRGRAGRGMPTETAFSVPRTAFGFWLGRLTERGVAFDLPTTRFGERVLPFRDPDGLPLALVADGAAGDGPGWADGPVPPAHAVRSLHGVTLASAAPERTARLLTDVFGYEQAGEEEGRTRFRAPGDAPGRHIDLVRTQERGREGTGTVHHVAFRCRDDDEQRAWQERIASAGLDVTDVRERTYFRSVYFREPGGILFEIATEGPGFTADEPPAALGAHLKLPPWLEPHRARLEASLVALKVPGATSAVPPEAAAIDPVQEASEQSFPASDAPGWTGTTLT